MEEKHIILPNLDNSYMYKYLDKGKNGSCYLTEDGNVFKKFNCDLDNYDDFIRIVGIKNPSFVFPNETVYLGQYGKEYLLGYIMDYIEGCKLSELPVSVIIRDIFNSLDLAEKDILYLTQEENVVLFDMHEENTILLPDGRMKFLDPDMFYLSYDDPYEKYKMNLKELGLFILDFFLKNYNIRGDKLREYYNRCILTGKMKPSYVLFEALDEMERESGENIKTFGDFYRVKRLLMK